MDAIVITGVGVVSPLGIGAGHWVAATAGATAIRPASRFATLGPCCAEAAEVVDLDPAAYLPKRGLRNLNRAIVFARIAARQALHDAQLADPPPDPSTVGVILGTNGACTGQMLEFEHNASAGVADPLMFPNTGLSAPACQISVFESYHSQTSTLSSGHAAGLDALVAATQVLRAHEASTVIAGGVEELCGAMLTASACAGVLYADAGIGGAWPGPFGGLGVVKGEGCACLVLEREHQARGRHAPLLAEVGAAASAFDPDLMLHGRANVEQMIELMRCVLQESDLTPDQVGVVISGAQGHASCDRAEAEALTAIFGSHGVPVVAPCAQLGDLDGALGAFQVATAAMVLREGRLLGRAVRRHPSVDLVHGSRPSTAQACLLTTFGPLGERVALVLKRCA